MHFDHSKIFVTKFALEFTQFQNFQPSAWPSAFGCIDLWQPKAKPKVRNLQLRPKTFDFGRPLLVTLLTKGHHKFGTSLLNKLFWRRMETELSIMIVVVIVIWYSDMEIKFRKMEKKFGLDNCLWTLKSPNCWKVL